MVRTTRVVAGLMAAGLALVGFGGAAVADPMNPTTPEDGLWYFYQLHLDEIHALGITGKGVTIAILDSPINLEVPTLQGANIDLKDSFCRDGSGAPAPGTSPDWDLANHGTEVVSLVAGTGAGYPGSIGVQGVAPGAKVLFYPRYQAGDSTSSGDGCYDETGATRSSTDVIALSIEDAVSSGAQIISMSFGGVPGGTEHLNAAIATALRHGVILVAALANNGGDLVPASNNGVVSVLSGASDGSLQLTNAGVANTSPLVDVVGPGVSILEQGGATDKNWASQSFAAGTSEATPIVAAELALDMQKYPNATTNQILQAMIHNTGASGVSHDPVRSSDLGYGTVTARTLLLADPTQYPDSNPFIDTTIPNGSPNGPSVAEIAGKTTPTATPTTAPTPTPNPNPGVNPTTPGTTVTGSSSLVPLLVVAGIVLLLIIIAAIVVIVIVAARKQHKGQTPS